jgi:NADH-quinone oxidoreductase subunit C
MKDNAQSNNSETADESQTENSQNTAPNAAEATRTGILNDWGRAVGSELEKVIAPHALNSGGRDDLPWVEIEPEHILSVAELCRDDPTLQMDLLHCLFAVDYETSIQVVYILFSITLNKKVMLKVNVDPENPHVPSVTSVWEAASWYERETHDLFGVVFEGNSNLTPLLLYDGFPGFPGRKNFPLHDYKEY